MKEIKCEIAEEEAILKILSTEIFNFKLYLQQLTEHLKYSKNILKMCKIYEIQQICTKHN